MERIETEQKLASLEKLLARFDCSNRFINLQVEEVKRTILIARRVLDSDRSVEELNSELEELENYLFNLPYYRMLAEYAILDALTIKIDEKRKN